MEETNPLNIVGQSIKAEVPIIPDGEKKGLFIKTFGCQMNEYDSLKLERILAAGYSKVSEAKDADLVLINTCSVRDKPEQKLYSYIGEIAAIKRRQNLGNIMIGVGGCVAQQEGINIIKRSRDVDFVFGTHNLSLVPSLIEQRVQGSEPQVAIDYRDDWEDLPLDLPEGSRTSAFIAISRGCNKNCTYCIVPTTRGKEVSRSLDEIVREAKIAVHRGVREIYLLGQTVNSYGLDFNPRISFVQLMNSIAEIEGVERIRFTSPHPQEVRDDFIDLVTSNPKVCHHIHMPLQSGSDTILKAMNRNYRRDKYLKIIKALKDRVPDMAITTDIIVGFPGETREDFEQTLDIMRQVQFDNSYTYIFSPRPGTKAALIEDNQPREEKLAWLQELQALQIEIAASRLTPWVGKTAQILVEGPSNYDSSCVRGRNSQNVMVNLVEPAPDLEPGMLVDVEITEACRFTLKGRLKV